MSDDDKFDIVFDAFLIFMIIACIVMAVFGTCTLIAVACEERVVDSEVLEVIDLPSSSVELILVDDMPSEARVIQTFGDVVGVKTYGNVTCSEGEWKTLTVIKQNITRDFGKWLFPDYTREVAIFS